MAVFHYRATDPLARPVSGTLIADTARQVRDQLRGQGLRVDRVTERAERVGPRMLATRSHSAKVTSFVRELSTLTGVGIAPLDAIETLARQETGRFRSVLMQLEDRVAAGGGLASAMREQPAVFDELAVSLVEVGESAGNLDVVLDRLADFRERSSGLRGRITTALIYPAIVLCVATFVGLMLMTFVVPKLLGSIIEAGQPIPPITRVVKAISDLLIGYWWLLLGIAVASVGAILAIVRSDGGQLAWHRLQLRLPVFGEAVRKQSIVRVALVMSTLMRSGVVFVQAIRIAQRSTTNRVIRDALARCERAVTSGSDIADALRETGAFPSMVVQIFAVGQRSGRLEDMLDRLAADYDRQVTSLSQRLGAVLEPALILAMVILVGFIALATILPMMQAADSI